MKYIKIITIGFLAGIINISCEDDGGDAAIELQSGAVPNIE